MHINQYHLVDARARQSIDLRDHDAEIRRAFRYVPFVPGHLTTHQDHFEFITTQPLTATDARRMGRSIAASAIILAKMAVKVYASTPQSRSRTSTQLFKRK
jgi:hypothetical protein